MSQTIVFRENTWNWCYYSVVAILVFSILFFFVSFIRGLRFVFNLDSIRQIAAQEGKAYTVTVSVWFNCILYAIMTIAAIYLLWIGGQDTFNGFTSAEIIAGSVRLIYIWPMSCRLISDAEIQEIKLKKIGRYEMRMELTTTNGEHLKSADGHSEDIRTAQADFIRALHGH